MLFSVHGLDTSPPAPFVAYSKSIAYTIPEDNVMKYKYGYTLLMQGLHGCVDINFLPQARALWTGPLDVHVVTN